MARSTCNAASTSPSRPRSAACWRRLRRCSPASCMAEAGWVTKNSKEHASPCGQLAADILATVPRRNSTDLLFPSRVSDERPLSGWSKYKKQLKDGVKGWTLHDLRRTYRSIHGQIGTQREIAERLINHAAGVTTEVEQIYDLHTYLPEMRKAVE